MGMVLEPGSCEDWCFVTELMPYMKTAFRKEHFEYIERRLLSRLEEIGRDRDESKLAASQKCVPEDEVKQLKAESKEVQLQLSRAEAELRQLKSENEEVKLRLSSAEASAGFWKRRFMALEPRVLQLEQYSEIMSKESQMSQGGGAAGKETNLDGQVLSAMNAPNSVTHPPSDYVSRENVETVVGEGGQTLQAAGDRLNDFYEQQLVLEKGRTEKQVGSSKLGNCQHASRVTVEISDSDSDSDAVDLTAGASKRTLIETKTSSDQVNQKLDNLFLTPLKRKWDIRPSLRKKENERSSVICSRDHLMYSEDSEDVKTDPHNVSSSKRCFSRFEMSGCCWSWVSETDMNYAFLMYPQPCMEAICALYRRSITVDKKTVIDQGSSKLDKLSFSSLAEFLIDGDPHFKLKKSVKELEAYDCRGIDTCRRIALGYSSLLFDIYMNGGDPLFLSHSR